MPSILVGVAVIATLAFSQSTIDRGRVTGRQYKNSFFGFTLTPAESLTFDSLALAKMPCNLNTCALLAAVAALNLTRARATSTVYVDKLSYYPGNQRTLDAYTHKVQRNQLASGAKLISSGTALDLDDDGTLFTESEFELPIPAREAIYVTERNGYVLVFIFTAASEKELKSVIQSTKIKFDQPMR